MSRSVYARKRRQDNLEIIRQYKEDRACIDCGLYFPYPVMEFDHISEKSFELSDVKQQSIKRVMQEISKCELVCANCHRLRTHARKQHLNP